MWKSAQFQRFVRTALSVSLLLIFALPEVLDASVTCTDEDKKYAKVLGNYYNPEDAYKFGLTIKQLIADRDLAGLFELVRGELSWGPRKQFIENQTFDQIFTEDWRNAVLEDEIPCSPVGWRGFMLGNGKIWYRFSGHFGNIYGINGAAEEGYMPAITDPAWRVEGTVIPPECFVREWISGNNFEEYADTYGMNYWDFRKYTGKYFGREIDRIGPITAWGRDVHLITVLGDCPISRFFDDAQKPLKIDADYVSRERCTDENYCLSNSYRLLTPLSQVECQNLAAHLPGQCESAYLVETAEETGGSMGTDYRYNFYGLFNLEDGRKAIVPLVNFRNENNARNFLDGLRISL